jgi:hypothetical protein
LADRIQALTTEEKSRLIALLLGDASGA